MIIKPMIRNGICMNAHPEGCAIQVADQIKYVQEQGPIDGTKFALIVGSSTGYGLASRIVSSFACGAPTIGVFFERPGTDKRSGTAGYYNTNAFGAIAKEEGIDARSINGDAFSTEIKEQVIDEIKASGRKIDLVIYSLAAPVRTDPSTGVTYRSVIKPIGEAFHSISADPFSRELVECSLEPATEEEIEATTKVMGGEDWAIWLDVLQRADVLDKGVSTVAYSYIGPPATHAMYRNGTIGRAKEHLEETAARLTSSLAGIDGRAFVSVNKALVTRASAVIPVVPLYISLLYRVMKEKQLHENCIHQIYRLYSDRLYQDQVPTDDEGRIRMDDYEMREDVQREVDDLWKSIDSTGVDQIADFDGYQETFLKFHGFGVDGVDYDREVTP